MAKSGYCVLLIGEMGCGKTPYAKQLAESNDQHRLVADVRKEYPITYQRRFVDTEEDYEDFMHEAENVRDTNIIIEEATAFFNGYNDKKLLKFVTGIQHNHCIGIFCFHSIKKTPQTLIDLAQYIVLWDTGEAAKKIALKETRFLNYLNDDKPTLIDKRDKKKWREPE